MGAVFLYLAHREPQIKVYALYAGTFAIFMSFCGLFGLGHAYRISRDQTTNPQPSAENVTKTTSTEDAWEDEKLQGTSNTAEFLV